MAGGHLKRWPSLRSREDSEENTMKTTKPVKKTGKLTSTKIEKKAPLVRIA